MPLDLGHGKSMDDAPGTIGVVTWKDAARAGSDVHGARLRIEYPALPDTITSDPVAGRIDPRAWFAHPHKPLELEIGCGKGTFILEQSGANLNRVRQRRRLSVRRPRPVRQTRGSRSAPR